MKKKIYILIIIFFSIIGFLNYEKKIGQFLQKNLSYKYSQFFYIFYDFNIAINRLGNDYNAKFLPRTELIELEQKKISVNKYLTKDASSFYLNSVYKYNSFYIDSHSENLFLLNSKGEIFFSNFENLDKSIFSFKKIQSNLSNNFNAIDIFIYQNKIYISGTEKMNTCNYLNLYSANINFEKLIFRNIFKSNECADIVRGGRIQKVNTRNNKNKILLSTFADPWKEDLIEYDPKLQSDKSIYGKILLINEDDLSYSIFSKGHRNIQGLVNFDNNIIATEHGPNGGDEINKIIPGGNYGWNKVSYGRKYFNNDLYLSEHKKNGLIEPLYVFLPSIGISEIIFLDNSFAEEWNRDFIVSSLNSRSIYRIKFDNNFSKVIYQEKIFIGERIRDLIIIRNKKIILLALEESGAILILKKNEN